MTNDNPRVDDAQDRQDDVDIGRLLQLLSNARRRHMLAVLADADDTLTVGELTRRIRAREASAGESPPTDEIRVSLHHVHLPKAEVCEIIDWDRAGGRIRYRGSRRLDRLLETVRTLSRN